MADVLVVRFVSCEGPGYLGDFLERHGHSYHVVGVDHHEDIPITLDPYRGLILMGGPMSANDNLEWTRGILDMVRRAHTKNIPILGHCLGSQLIARALGADITTNAVKEIGWYSVYPETISKQDWFTSPGQTFDAFHWHGETFSVPTGATRILSSDACINQGFVIGNTLALQCHIEITEVMIEQWAALYQHEIETPSDTIQSLETMMSNASLKIEPLRRQADTIYRSWISLID